MTLASTRPLQERVVKQWMIEEIQGAFTGEFFLPTEGVENTVFVWFERGIVGGQTPEVDENDPGPSIHTEYRQRSGRIKFYRETFDLSIHGQSKANVAGVDLARDNIKYLTSRGNLRLESLRINAIVAGLLNAAQWENKFWTDLSVGGREWVGGSGAVSIYDDIIDASNLIRKYARIPTNTVLVPADVVGAVQKSAEHRDWDRKGPMSVEFATTGTVGNVKIPVTENPQPEQGSVPFTEANVGKFAGHEVFVSSAVTLTDEDDIQSDLEPILEDYVFVFRRGQLLGKTMFYETQQMRSKPVDNFTDTQRWQHRFASTPLVYRRQLIFGYLNPIA